MFFKCKSSLFHFFTLIIFTSLLSPLSIAKKTNESQVYREDFMGSWKGKSNGENIEIALWLVEKGLDADLGGYIVFPDSHCIQQLDVIMSSEASYEQINKIYSQFVNKKTYLNGVTVATRFPKFTDQNRNCVKSKIVSYMSGKAFSGHISIIEYGQLLQLAYSQVDPELEKARKKPLYTPDQMAKKIVEASKKDPQALPRLMEEMRVAQTKHAMKNMKVNNTLHKTTLKRSVMSATMKDMATGGRQYPAHPAPSAKELTYLLSTED